MSVRVLSKVFEDPYFTEKMREEYLVAIALADFAHDDGLCWPGMETIARKARMSVRTAQRAISTMVAAKKIIRLPRKKEGSNVSDTSLFRFTYELGGVSVTPPGDKSPGGVVTQESPNPLRTVRTPLTPLGGEETAVRPDDYLPLFDRKKKAAENGEWTEALMKAARIEYPDATWPNKFKDLPVDIQDRVLMRMKVMMAV